MQVERIDHVHIKCSDLEESTERMENFTGTTFMRGIDYTADHGMEATYGPFPCGLEMLHVTDDSKSMGAIYAKAPEGVFALSYKVTDMTAAITDMEALGHKLLLKYEFGPIREALFDTKDSLGVYIELIDYGDAAAGE